MGINVDIGYYERRSVGIGYIEWITSSVDYDGMLYIMVFDDNSKTWVVKLGEISAAKTSYDFEFDLQYDKSYRVRIDFKSPKGNSISGEVEIPAFGGDSPVKPKPDTFKWTTAKVQYEELKITAEEWNNLIDKVHEWEDYFNKTRSSLTKVSTGNDITASGYNQVRNAIVSIGGQDTTLVNSFTDIAAHHYNSLSNALNAL